MVHSIRARRKDTEQPYHVKEACWARGGGLSWRLAAQGPLYLNVTTSACSGHGAQPKVFCTEDQTGYGIRLKQSYMTLSTQKVLYPSIREYTLNHNRDP